MTTEEEERGIKMTVPNMGRIFTKVREHMVKSQNNLLLTRPIRKADHIKFDRILYHFSMTADHMENLNIFTGERSRLNFSKRFHNFMVWFILFAYFVRSLACVFITNRRWLMYLGDISPYLGGFRMMFLIPVACWSFYALALNSLFTFHGKATEWLYPFGLMKGLVTPAEAGFTEVKQIKRLVLRVRLTFAAIEGMILSAAFFAGLLFMTIPFFKYESRADVYKYGLPWGLLQGIWTYYCAGNICGNFAYFHILCYYLALRFEKLNRRVKYLADNRNEITDLKLSKELVESSLEHNQISSDLVKYNKFWSNYAAINYFTFIPLECFVVYIALFGNIEFMVWVTFAVLSLECGTILCIVVLSGAMVSKEVSLLRLNQFSNHWCYLSRPTISTAIAALWPRCTCLPKPRSSG